MTTTVITSSSADEDIARIDAWWRENRPASPDLFLDEMSEALALISASPFLGRRYLCSKIPRLRRLLLRATRYHVYYVEQDDVVTILAVHSALRRRGPTITP